MTKSDYISKTKNRKKKIVYTINERQVNSNLPCKFGHFWRKLNYLGAQNAPFGRPRHSNALWCDIKFYAYNFLRTLRIFNVNISLVVTGPEPVSTIYILLSKYLLRPGKYWFNNDLFTRVETRPWACRKTAIFMIGRPRGLHPSPDIIEVLLWIPRYQ